MSQAAGDATAQPKLFGTFTGVFTPTLLTILGVIMFVRLGWVVGNAGLLGAWMIIGLALIITITTGLSLSSIATNTRIGAGGPYAVIARSLGLEVGGSVGIPLYLSRPLGIAMYVFGFREGWMWVFPTHSPLLIDLLIFGAIFGISYWSADLAFRVQYLIMAVIAASLVSIVFAPVTFEPPSEITWWGEYPGFPERDLEGTDFWEVFAVFFPATTGILAGANMSGELKDPRRAIPVGALSAIALSSVIYLGLAWWATRAGTTHELVTNYTLFIDKALWPPAVLAGLLGATFSSALAGMVGGPRILMAMGEDRIMPFSRWMAARADNGEPRNALILTGVLTFVCLMFRDLNVIAPLVTMFFLITYCVINVVVLVEGGLGLVSFRPELRIPLWVPLSGAVLSLFAMFIVSPTFGILAAGTSLAIYLWIQQFGIPEGEHRPEDVRSSIFVAVAEWAATKVLTLEDQSVRAWKPKMLVPTEDPAEIRGEYDLITDMCLPEGSVKLLGLATRETNSALTERIHPVGRAFQDRKVFATWTVMDTPDFATGVAGGLQALQSAFFRPNILLLNLPESREEHKDTLALIELARRTGVGVLLVGWHPKAGLGRRNRIDLWLRPQAPDWDPARAFREANLNLAVLMAYRLARRWKAELHVLTAVSEETEVHLARAYLEQVRVLTRLPAKCRRRVLVGDFREVVAREPSVDLHIFGLPENELDLDFVGEMVRETRSTCLFVADSGRESALV